MSTKLVISVDGLLLTNLNTIVSSRSIDEVILVGTSSQFNNLSSAQTGQIETVKNSNIGTASLSLAFADESSVSLEEGFYNFITSNNLSFFNDPGLQSLSSAVVLTSTGSETFTEISADNLSNFDTSNLIANSLYTDGGSLSLGSNFGSKPEITFSPLATPLVLSDLSGSVTVTISASQFATILENNVNPSTLGTAVSVSDVSNISVIGDTSDTTPIEGSSYAVDIFDFFNAVENTVTTPALDEDGVPLVPALDEEGLPILNEDGIPLDEEGNPTILTTVERTLGTPIEYDGTNRLPNTSAAGPLQTTPGDNFGSVYFEEQTEFPYELSVLQALRLPLMGVTPYQDNVVLTDTAENLSLALRTFTDGQITSFNEIIVSDDGILTLDPETFARLDTAISIPSWSNHEGVTVTNSTPSSDGSPVNATIHLTGSLTDYINAGLYNGTSFATSLTPGGDAANLISQVQEAFLSGTLSSLDDITNHITAITASGESEATTNLTFSSGITEEMSAAFFMVRSIISFTNGTRL